MYRFSAVFGVAVLGLALLVGTGISGGGAKKTPAQLPAGWGKLGLSKEQKTKIYAIRGGYRTKIHDLEKQIEELRTEERSKMAQVLTPDQKDKLRKLATGESTAPRKESKDK